MTAVTLTKFRKNYGEPPWREIDVVLLKAQIAAEAKETLIAQAVIPFLTEQMDSESTTPITTKLSWCNMPVRFSNEVLSI